MIRFTHVCRAWREVFVSRSTLWTNIDCKNNERTRVYLERSKTSPISLSLYRPEGISPSDPFFNTIPHAIGRLKSLFVEVASEHLRDITAHLCRPAPVLEDITIWSVNTRVPHRNPVLTPSLFNGEFPSLRKLCLESVRTKLPWRSMANLTWFMLAQMSLGEISLTQLLDFFESTPHLRNVELYSVILTPGAERGRLVTLGCLEKMEITDCGPSSILLNHLSIPVGATLWIEVDSANSLIEDLLPRSLDNLGNLSNFTTVQLSVGEPDSRMEFSGPNGKVSMTLTRSRADGPYLVLQSLAQLDTSKTEKLVIEKDESLPTDSVYQALLPMKALRTLTLSKCKHSYTFIHALHPSTSLSEAVVCPKLEEVILVSRSDREGFDIEGVVEVAAARASRGKKLGTVRIVGGGDVLDPKDVLELKKHVRHVEYGRG